MDQLLDFIGYSHQVGTPRHVQGGGGNTSFKLDDEWMLIKASGTFLSEMIPACPGVKVKYQRLVDTLEGNQFPIVSQEHEDSLNAFTDKNTDKDFIDKKASIETSVHAIIPYKYVVHTHLVDINIFTTAKEGQSVLSSIWPEDMGCGWIPYVSPGLGLTLEILKQYPKRSDIPQILLFENHGIVFAADSLSEVGDLYQEVTRMCDQFRLDNDLEAFKCNDLEAGSGFLFPGNYLSPIILGQKLTQHCFPDSVVFGQDLGIDMSENELQFKKENHRKNKSVWENLCSVNYLNYAHHKLGWTPKYLTESDQRYILDMGREKHRIKLNQ